MRGFLKGNGDRINKEESVAECKEFLRGYVQDHVVDDVDGFVYHIVDNIIHKAIENVDYDISQYPWEDVFYDLKYTFEYGDIIRSIEDEFDIVFYDDDISVIEDLIAVYAQVSYFRHKEKLTN